MVEFYDYTGFKQELHNRLRNNSFYGGHHISDEDLEFLDSLDGKKDGKISESTAGSIFHKATDSPIRDKLKNANSKEIGEFTKEVYKDWSYHEASADKVNNLTNMNSNPISTTLVLKGTNDKLMNKIQKDQKFIDKITLEYGVTSISKIAEASTYRIVYKKQNGGGAAVYIKPEDLNDFVKRLENLQNNENNQVILETASLCINQDDIRVGQGRARSGLLNYLNIDEVLAELNNDNSEKPKGDITLNDFKAFQYTNTGNEEQTVMGEKIKSGETVIFYFTKANRSQVNQFLRHGKNEEAGHGTHNIKQIFFYEQDIANIQKSNQEDDTSSDNEFANMLQEVDVTQNATRKKKYVRFDDYSCYNGSLCN